MGRIVDLKTTPIDRWLPGVLAAYPAPPNAWIPGVAKESQAALLERGLRETLLDDTRVLIGCECRGRIAGIASLRPMAWDTRHFGFPVFRLEHFATWGAAEEQREAAAELADAVTQRARELGARTVHAWLPMDAVPALHALEQVGFRTMDILVTWAFDHRQQVIPDYADRCTIRGYRSGDAEVLIPLARAAYRNVPDRFHSDPHLAGERADEVYGEWVRNSISGQLADHIVVAELDGRPAGYTTLKLEGEHGGLSNVRTGALVLSAVAPWAEGKGLYTSMIRAGLLWLEGQGVEVSHLGTQVNNFPVQRAWARLGFRPAKAGPSLHLWLDE